MNYSNLFNTLHSEIISEEVKEDIVSKILDKVVLTNEDLLAESINESNDKIAPYIEALSLLVNSDITNEALEEAIDEIFANETQEVVDSVTEAFKEDIVRGILVEQLLEEEGLNEESTPIGLSALRRKWGEEPIPSLKKDTNKAPKAESTPSKTEAPKKSSSIKTNVITGEGNKLSGGSQEGKYRYVNTSALKSAATKARNNKGTSLAVVKAESQAPKSTEAPQASTGKKVEQSNSKNLASKIDQAKTNRAIRKSIDRHENKIAKQNAANQKRQAKAVEGAIGNPLSNKVRKNKGNTKGSETSDAERVNAQRGAGIDTVHDETDEEKIAKLEDKNNKGAINAVNSKNAPVQQKLDLKSVTEEPKAETPKKKVTKKVVKKEAKVETEIKPEVKQETTKKRGGSKKNVTTPSAETPKVEETPKEKKSEEGNSKTTKSSKVYLKGGNEPPKSKPKTNYESSDLEKDLYSVQQEMKEMREDGKTKTPEYQALKDKMHQLKSQRQTVKESLVNSLTTLFASNISESSLKDICEMVAASKKNADAALRRRTENFEKALDAVNKDLEANRTVNPELAKKAEEEGAKKEAFEQRYNKKFNKES